MKDSQVAVILEDIRAQFKAFGEGLQALQQKAEQNAQDHKLMMETNQREHRLMMQMIQELGREQNELKRIK